MKEFSCSVIVQKKEINVNNEIKLLKLSKEKTINKKIGATVTFTGSVRESNEGDKITSMFLEHYPEMTERSIYKILAQAQIKWPIFNARVTHRIGLLTPGENIVFVGVSSSHRKASFESCEYIMDYLKTQALFWKKEMTKEGARWVKAKGEDDAKVKFWEKNIEK